MRSLQDFLASPDENRAVTGQFEAHKFALDFSQRRPSYLSDIPTCGGIYFIAGKCDQVLKVYVGKTNNLRARIADYHRAFQVHCPNDRKMAFFQEWLNRVDPGWTLVLHTMPVEVEALSGTESLWIDRLKPLVNATVRGDEAERHAVQEASRRYFEAFFSNRLTREGK